MSGRCSISTLGRAAADQIDVTGLLTLNSSALNLSDLSGLGVGTYALIHYGTLSGSLANLAIASSPDNFSYRLLDTGSAIDLQVSLAGDFNSDGVVNLGDYLVWRKGLGAIYTQSDYDTWRTPTLALPFPSRHRARWLFVPSRFSSGSVGASDHGQCPAKFEQEFAVCAITRARCAEGPANSAASKLFWMHNGLAFCPHLFECGSRSFAADTRPTGQSGSSHAHTWPFS